MPEFLALGPIDMAKVSYPLRDVGYPYAVGARSEALLLINGDPPILDVDDLTKLDKPALEQDPSCRALKRRYPNLELWGAGRGGTIWEPVRKRPDGGQSFDIIYFLNPGRPAGRWLSGLISCGTSTPREDFWEQPSPAAWVYFPTKSPRTPRGSVTV